MPLSKTEKVAAAVVVGTILGGVAGFIWGKTDPRLNIQPETQTSRGFNPANLGTAVEAGLTIGGFTAGAIALAVF